MQRKIPTEPEKNTDILPELRQDLEILQGGKTSSGAPYWLIHDRIKSSYFRISEQFMELLGIWDALEPGQLAAKANTRYQQNFSEENILELAEFLYANSLTITPPSGEYKGYWGQSEAGKQSWWMKLIHNYLFFRIPIARPQGFLDKTWPFVSILFSRSAVTIYVIFAIVGLYLVSRQWTMFLSTFASFLTLEGFALYALSLVFIKSLHELGHAYMAKRYGVEVPTIGAAFIVMMPILYTNTTGAWKLADRKQRLMIDAAGIFTELAIASICTVLWVFLPDGNLRGIAFTTATLSWIMSLTVNLNPFMKFDGYYILSDALDFENLQSRSFAMAKWWIREKLFGLGNPPPEGLELKIRLFIIVHAISVWIYRFFLFLGIALLVYHFFFKILGIFMFAVEMIWFIGLPIWREIEEWLKMKDQIRKAGRYKFTGVIILAGFLAALYPFSNTVRVPAIMAQANETTIHLPFPARLTEVNFTQGIQVKSGQILMRFNSPDLNHEISNTLIEQQNINARMARSHADNKDRSNIQVLNRQAIAVKSKLAGLIEKQTKLEIRAPHDGIVVDVLDDLHGGRWINPDEQLFLVRTRDKVQFKALIDDKSRRRIKPDAVGRFIPDNIRRPVIAVNITNLSNVASTGFELEYLSDIAGSLIAVTTSPSGETKAKGAWFSVRFAPLEHAPAPDRVLRGIVILDAEPESLLSQIFKQVASVLVREASI